MYVVPLIAGDAKKQQEVKELLEHMLANPGLTDLVVVGLSAEGQPMVNWSPMGMDTLCFLIKCLDIAHGEHMTTRT